MEERYSPMEGKTDHRELLTRALLTHALGLKRFAMSLCKNITESEDLVAETVVKSFENFGQLKDINKIRPWLFKILHNQFISNCRHNVKFKLDHNAIQQAEEETFSLFEELSKSNFIDEDTPEKKFIRELTQKSISEAVEALPRDFKVALVLCDVEDFSYSEIAAITHVPVGTVRSRIARARTILQKKLWKQAEELGIKKKQSFKKEKEYVCTCGKEEDKTLALENKSI